MNGPCVSLTPSILPLRLENVSYVFRGRALLTEVNLTIAAGGKTIILGPNGAGKSLIMRLCHGLLTPTAGRVTWAGGPVARARDRQAMVFQRPIMLRRSVAENVEYPLSLRGMARDQRRQRAQQALQKAGLRDFTKRPARLLSGGEQQRVALARAWVTRPEALLLDEPTANLDPTATGAVERVIEEFAQSGTKIIMSTHDLGGARRLADEIVFIYQGRIAEHQPARQFFSVPQSREAAAFVAGHLSW
jgi:tungstate transport system ATP-binding protein